MQLPADADRKLPACIIYVPQVMRVLGVPLPFYKSPTLLLGWGVSPFVFWQLLKARPDVIHAAFPGELCLRPPPNRVSSIITVASS